MSRRSVVATLAAAPVAMRPGTPTDADALFELIRAHQAEGHLLPRGRAELSRRAPHFVLATAGGRLVGCAELAPLSQTMAEVRSLVVSPEYRGLGLGTQLVGVLRDRAVALGYRTLSAFTHDARLFIKNGFSIAPHPWVPEKIARDCATCDLFLRCGQHAMLLGLKESNRHGTVVEDGRARVA